MMEFTTTTVAGLITVAVLYFIHYVSSNLPWLRLPSPGLCLPFLGHIHKFLTKEALADPINGLWDMFKKHQKNGVMWSRSFNMDILWVGDHDTLHYLFNHPQVQGRMNPRLLTTTQMERKLTPGQDIPGVLISEGRTWVEQRRFALRTLRDFGFGKAGMEEMIKEEVQLFTEEIKKNEGKPFDFINKFNLPILNALWNVTVGQRFDYNDPELVSLIERVTNWFKRVAHPASVLVLVFPALFKRFPKLLEYNETLDISHDVLDMITKTIGEHEETIDHNEPRDFTDKALTEIKNTTDPTSSFFGKKGRENLANTLLDLFLAGSETTSTTLTWALLYMARYPEVQKKVQEEMVHVVGQGQAPSLKDKPNLPYTEAVLMEIQRYANIVPNGVNHSSTKDIVVNGMTIPAGTLFMPLMVELLKGSYWGDGEVFRPERFLDSTGSCKKDDHLIPFSIGKRQCLGETLAKAELFLFFTGLLANFDILPEVEGKPPSEDYNNGITILPKPFLLRLHNRT